MSGKLKALLGLLGLLILVFVLSSMRRGAVRERYAQDPDYYDGIAEGLITLAKEVSGQPNPSLIILAMDTGATRYSDRAKVALRRAAKQATCRILHEVISDGSHLYTETESDFTMGKQVPVSLYTEAVAKAPGAGALVSWLGEPEISDAADVQAMKAIQCPMVVLSETGKDTGALQKFTKASIVDRLVVRRRVPTHPKQKDNWFLNHYEILRAPP